MSSNDSTSQKTCKTWKCEMLDDEIVQDSACFRPVLMYRIEVSNGEKSWIIRHRYSEFLTCLERLKELMEKDKNLEMKDKNALPVLPPRNFSFFGPTYDFLKERKEGLKKFLSMLCSKEFCDIGCVKSFLDPLDEDFIPPRSFEGHVLSSPRLSRTKKKRFVLPESPQSLKEFLDSYSKNEDSFLSLVFFDLEQISTYINSIYDQYSSVKRNFSKLEIFDTHFRRLAYIKSTLDGITKILSTTLEMDLSIKKNFAFAKYFNDCITLVKELTIWIDSVNEKSFLAIAPGCVSGSDFLEVEAMEENCKKTEVLVLEEVIQVLFRNIYLLRGDFEDHCIVNVINTTTTTTTTNNNNNNNNNYHNHNHNDNDNDQNYNSIPSITFRKMHLIETLSNTFLEVEGDIRRFDPNQGGDMRHLYLRLKNVQSSLKRLKDVLISTDIDDIETYIGIFEHKIDFLKRESIFLKELNRGGACDGEICRKTKEFQHEVNLLSEMIFDYKNLAVRLWSSKTLGATKSLNNCQSVVGHHKDILEKIENYVTSLNLLSDEFDRSLKKSLINFVSPIIGRKTSSGP